MKRRIEINDRDEVFLDRIVAIKSDPSDQLSRLQMHPRGLSEEVRQF